MPNTLLSGPAGAGKSQEARRLRDAAVGPVVIADFQSIYAALLGLERGPDGRYPERQGADAYAMPLTEYTRRVVIQQARERDIEVIATNSDGDKKRRAALLAALGPGAAERVIDPGRAVVEARLSDSITGKLSRQCQDATGRWYDRL